VPVFFISCIRVRAVIHPDKPPSVQVLNVMGNTAARTASHICVGTV